MHSAIYSGWLRHRRAVPRPHAFSYRVYMVYLDLAELDQVFGARWLWSATRPAPARFDRADHLGDPTVPLDEAVRQLVSEHLAWRPAGPVRLLTNLRSFGFGFNPVSFYYCFDAAGERVEAIVAEVHNTPWGERHCYVLDQRQAAPGQRWLRSRSSKAMHVSPFHPMELEYAWGFAVPAERLAVHMALSGASTGAGDDTAPRVFDATLSLQRERITAFSRASVLLRFPLMAMKVVAAIHWQALRLWLKRTPVYTHPAKLAESNGAAGTNPTTPRSAR